MASMSTTMLATTTLNLASSPDGSSYGSTRYAAEVEGATNRFAAAQKLFKEQAASSPQSPTPSPSTRQRTNTNTSLYTKLDFAVSNPSSQPGQDETLSGSDNTTFTDAFMKSRPRQIAKPITTPALAASQPPPTPVHDGCILLGPRRALQPLDVTKQIRAKAPNGAPAWYCRQDKLVIFDGMRDGKFTTRSSRGLDMARRNCGKVVISVDIPCGHCRDLLKRDTWVFEERMLECRVCKNCQDRCALILEKQKIAEEVSEVAQKNVPVEEPIEPAMPPEVEGRQAEPQAAQPQDQPMIVDEAKVLEGQTKRDSVLQDDDITVV